MSALLSDLEALLAREKVTLNEFCRTTGFPVRTIASMRQAAAPKQATIDRLLAALAAWKAGLRRERSKAEPARSSMFFPDAWAKSAEAASRAYVQALGGRSFDDAQPSGAIVDSTGPWPALTREPCPRCGVRGDIGCSHQLPMADAW